MSYYADQLMPSALEIEPILPHYLDIVKAIMQSHGGALEATTVFFPEGTAKNGRATLSGGRAQKGAQIELK